MTDVIEGNDQTDEATQAASAEATDAQPQYTEVEQIALDAGWKPAAEWKGEGHQTAADFLKHKARKGDDSASEVKRLEKRLEKVGKATDRLLEQALAEQRADLEAAHAQAVADNRPGEARKIARQMDNLEDKGSDYADDFRTRNPWYEKDEEATALAFGICERESKKNTPPERQLELAEAAVRKRFPELFKDGAEATGERKPTNIPALSGPGSRAPVARTKNFENLPPEAKAGCASFEKHLKNSTPEKVALFRKNFAANYYEENA